MLPKFFAGIEFARFDRVKRFLEHAEDVLLLLGRFDRHGEEGSEGLARRRRLVAAVAGRLQRFHLAKEGVSFLRAGENFHQLFGQVVVGVQFGRKVLEVVAGIEQGAEFGNPAHQRVGGEAVEVFEKHRHLLALGRRGFAAFTCFAAIRLSGLGREFDRHAGADVLEEIIEVVPVDEDELPLLVRRGRLRALHRPVAGQVGHDAHDEGELLLDDGIACFHVVGDLYPRWAYSLQRSLDAFCHVTLLFL
ncbi:MAG: hypothetical protein LUE17_11880 [Planctomycetaceae bacterium]|nr:hypothetical protein [Planctomycetaceae bacterium]